MDWTDEQKSAIDAPQGEGAILVSAAAGSGKTAVLVERIITKILDGKTSADRLLAVTFTNAAASEMREKIIKRMRKALKSESGKRAEYLKKQLHLAVNADILTIDSFCMRVVQNNYYALGIDPNFSIADTGEAQLLKDDALDALFEKLYREDNDRFNRMLDRYASNKDDNDLKELIKTVYKFIQPFAKPLEWLDEKSEMYEKDMHEEPWQGYIMDLVVNAIGEKYSFEFQQVISRAEDISGSDIVTAYSEMGEGLIKLKNLADMITRASSWKEANDIYKKYIYKGYPDSFTRKNKPKNIEVDIEDWKEICKKRNDVRNDFFDECEILSLSDDEMKQKDGNLKEIVDDIVWITKEFDAEYKKRKDIRNIKEFSDIEHLSYRVFTENETVRNEYKERYDEILIDEYQDTNELQDSIFRTISRDEKNLFMVGDLKQSIYKFRGGDPTIFKNKITDYSNEGSGNICIRLSQNFRSRQEILRAVNAVFEKYMSEKVGDVNYAGKERIVRENDKDAHDDMYKPEVIYTPLCVDNEDVSEVNAEAEIIADKIKEMIDEGFKVGGDNHILRASDVAILSRSIKGNTGIAITDALERRGISAYLEIDDYFQKREISLMLSVISVIDNCMQDIPLAAVMRSPIGDFSDNDLARIRTEFGDGDLYFSVKQYANKDMTRAETDKYLVKKCQRIIKRIKRWKNYTKHKSVAELIWCIYEETGLYDFVGVLESGEEAQANLRLLYERAKKYERAGFKGLFNFVKYIEKIKIKQNDLSSANLSDEGHNAVRVMTMHKSKGLEFPVVFLFGTSKSMTRNRSDKVLLHKDLGFGLMYTDAENKYYENLRYSAILKEIRQEELSEALRILYVAATRAKDKLIVTVTQKVSKKAFDDIVEEQTEKWHSGILSSKAKCYADWICSAAISSDTWDFTVGEYHGDTAETAKDDEEIDEELTDDLRRVVWERLDYSYKYPLSGAIPTKTSVSAMKQLENEKDEFTPVYADDVPAFMREGKKGSEIGTAHHNVMAFIDFDRIRNAKCTDEAVRYEIKRISDAGELESFYTENEEMFDLLTYHVTEFFKSRLGQEMLYADKVYRERAFQIKLPANKYDVTLGEEYGGEEVILQGIIDCCYVKDGKTVLLDYKTDRCTGDGDMRKIAERYSVQLDLYAEAMEKITGKAPDEKYLYLFAAGKEIRI